MKSKPRTRGPSKTRRPAAPADDSPKAQVGASKLDTVLKLLRRPHGASLAELVTATGWQTHSVRGALAGALKKKGHVVLSEKQTGDRRYRIEAA